MSFLIATHCSSLSPIVPRIATYSQLWNCHISLLATQDLLQTTPCYLDVARHFSLNLTGVRLPDGFLQQYYALGQAFALVADTAHDVLVRARTDIAFDVPLRIDVSASLDSVFLDPGRWERTASERAYHLARTTRSDRIDRTRIRPPWRA